MKGEQEERTRGTWAPGGIISLALSVTRRPPHCVAHGMVGKHEGRQCMATHRVLVGPECPLAHRCVDSDAVPRVDHQLTALHIRETLPCRFDSSALHSLPLTACPSPTAPAASPTDG